MSTVRTTTGLPACRISANLKETRTTRNSFHVTMLKNRKKNSWIQQCRKGDILMQGGLPTDIVIPIMGPTGSGKSTFINNLVGEDVVSVGQTMESCTTDITPVVVEIPNNPFFNGRRLIVVDTPGFDDTKGNDLEILRRIALWLASSYDAGMKLGGVVYLHDITQPRMVPSSRNNFSVFNKLCGKDAFTSIVLGTTRWSDISPVEAQNHLKALSQTVWKDMIKRGSIVQQVDNTRVSAWLTLYIILGRLQEQQGTTVGGGLEKFTVLKIQEEIVNFQKAVSSTEAGRALRSGLQELLVEQKRLRDAGEEDLDDINGRIGKTLRQLDDLCLPLPSCRKFLKIFGIVIYLGKHGRDECHQTNGATISAPLEVDHIIEATLSGKNSEFIKNSGGYVKPLSRPT